MTVDVREVGRAFDRQAPGYDRRWRAYLDATLGAAAAAAAPFEGNERILDVPCGTGELEALLLRQWPGLDVVGADLSAGMLRQARTKDAAAGVRWVQAKVSALPFPDERFDRVICANSFHCFAAPAAALSEMRRVLRPGGTLALVDWCDDYFLCKVCSVVLRLLDPGFFRSYTTRECRSLLQQNGFEIMATTRRRIDWLWGVMSFACRRP